MAGSGDILENFWPTFAESDLLEQVECVVTSQGLAVSVLDTYGIPYETGIQGGDLTDLDIKRMDALTVINLSLMEYAADNNYNFIEPIVNAEGKVEFVEIGAISGEISDVYYSLQTGSYREPCVGVLVTGARPIPIRKPIDWKPIWGDIDEAARIYAWQDLLGNCHKANFTRYANIVFNDPNLQSGYNDGIDNLYEIDNNNPYDRIIGYATFRDPPKELMSDDVTIDYVNQATIPIEVGVPQGSTGSKQNPPEMGKLYKLPKFSADDNVECWSDPGQPETPVQFQQETEIRIPSIFRYQTVRNTSKDKFNKVSGVYVVGQEIDYLQSAPVNTAASNADPTLQSNIKIWISINDQSIKTIKLREGVNYTIVYDDPDPITGTFKTPCIVFAKDVRRNDHADYGSNTKYFLDPFCDAAETPNVDLDGTGSILPLSKTRGFLVFQIWATVDLDTPSVVVNDPSAGRALEIATNLKYYLAAMIVEEKPSPIGYTGVLGSEIVDVIDSIKDHDPTTAQNFEDTRMEQIMDSMQGGGMSVNMSFLDEDQALAMSQVLYNYMSTNPGVETVYTCGPNCKPKLGGYGNTGGIINSIQYSYTDSGAYTISVNEGPFLVGNLAQVDGGPTQKMSEDVGAAGTIIEDLGNGMHFKIRLDGYGDRWGVSMCHSIMRVGDRVSCTIHNNPVEA